MKQSSLFFALCLFVIVGLPRIFSLDAHWSSDETRWLHRSTQLMNAVQTGQFDQTFLAPPGGYHLYTVTFNHSPGMFCHRFLLVQRADVASLTLAVFRSCFLSVCQ